MIPVVRKIGQRSNKIKQMQKKNTEDTQYKRDIDLRGSPSVGYVHREIARSFLYYYPANEGIQPTTKPDVTSSSFSHSLLSQNTIFTIIHSRNTFPSSKRVAFREKNPNIISTVRSATL
jgi:hypothetical protein